MDFMLIRCSTCRGAADWHAFTGDHFVGPVQTRDGQCQSVVERDVAAGACCAQESIVGFVNAE